RLLRRQHCSSLCSQSEGHEHVANMASAQSRDFVGFSARAWPPQYPFPPLQPSCKKVSVTLQKNKTNLLWKKKKKACADVENTTHRKIKKTAAA
ncbi:MAG: hypothetical protein UDM12_05040, partial [Prevotellamassilia sp.]|nr:hypothetical protein [Prevotellamassilia sp.]